MGHWERAITGCGSCLPFGTRWTIRWMATGMEWEETPTNKCSTSSCRRDLCLKGATTTAWRTQRRSRWWKIQAVIIRRQSLGLGQSIRRLNWIIGVLTGRLEIGWRYGWRVSAAG